MLDFDKLNDAILKGIVGFAGGASVGNCMGEITMYILGACSSIFMIFQVYTNKK